jgi:hypothetical protein
MEGLNNTAGELKRVLERFQEGYIKREASFIDTYMDGLFEKDDDILIIGTGNDEWCLGYDEAKEIFLSDWEYWGDVRIDTLNPVIDVQGETAWIFTAGTLSHTYSSSEETYARYLNYVKSFFDEEDEDNKNKSLKEKLAQINWILCHLLHHRDSLERKYQLDLRLSFVLVKKGDRWFIRHIQFTLPTTAEYPDERITGGGYTKESYENEKSRIGKYAMSCSCDKEGDIKKLLKDFNAKYLDKGYGAHSLAGEYFSKCCPHFVSTGREICSDLKSVEELICLHRVSWDRIDLNVEECMVKCNDEAVWVAGDGIIKRRITEEDALKGVKEYMDGMAESGLSDREKLFNIRRSIAAALKETARGEEYIWPLRFEGVLAKEEGRWVFRHMQLSFPFSVMLENKNYSEVLVK